MYTQRMGSLMSGAAAFAVAALLGTSASAATVAHWNFDEGSGQSAANSDGSATLALQLGSAGGADANDPAWSTGYTGGAIQGELASSQVTYARNAGWTAADETAMAPSSSYTIEMIINPDSIPVGGTFGSRAMGLVYYRDATNSKIQYLIRMYGGSTASETNIGVFSQFNDSTQADLAFNTNAANDGDQFLITAGNWYYIAATFDDGSDTMQLIVRDLTTGDEASKSLAWKPMFGLDATPSVQFTVGSEGTGGRSFDGKIDQLRISNSVVAEQDRIYNIPEPASAGLLGAGLLVLAWSRR